MRNYFNSFFNFFEFDGRPSTDFGVMVFSHGEYADPTPNETETKIPGMNGVLHFWDGSFSEVTITYAVMVRGISAIEVREKVERLRAWLLTKRKYCRLQDTLHPDYYRMGIYKGKSEVQYSENEQMGKLEINFQCKPQKFLKEGEFPIEYTANGQIYNPTDFIAKPLIKLYGTAGQNSVVNIQVSGTSVTHEVIVKMPDEGYAMIDCDLGEVYCGDTNLNADVSFPARNPDHSFPIIQPGVVNSVLIWNSTGLELTPRWWTL